jgi:hypothetical protein
MFLHTSFYGAIRLRLKFQASLYEMANVKEMTGSHRPRAGLPSEHWSSTEASSVRLHRTVSARARYPRRETQILPHFMATKQNLDSQSREQCVVSLALWMWCDSDYNVNVFCVLEIGLSDNVFHSTASVYRIKQSISDKERVCYFQIKVVILRSDKHWV